MDNKKIESATIVASTSATCWSQTYNAGSLFAAVSLNYVEEKTPGEKEPLSILGKDFLNSLEAEYFTLEEKNLESIKQALTLAAEKITGDKNINISLVLASVSEDVLYIYVMGDGKAFIKRGNSFGIVLAGNENSTLTSASGFLQNNDIVVLATEKFCSGIQSSELKNALNNNEPGTIAESLMPKVKELEEAGIASVIFKYKGHEEKEEIEQKPEDQNRIEEPTEPSIHYSHDKKAVANSLFSMIGKAPSVLRKTIHFLKVLKMEERLIPHSLSHRKKVILTVVVILFGVLIFSVVTNIKHRNDETNQQEVNNIIKQAQEKYDEGEGLLDLNKNLARDDFQAAEKILTEGASKFPKNSKEANQINDFLKKVNDALTVASGVNMVDAKPMSLADSPLLLAVDKNSNGLFFTQDDKNIYYVNNDAVFILDKKTNSKKSIIANKNDWKTAGGIGVYNGNIYILDKDANQILKYANSGSSYSKTDYLASETKPDFSNTADIAIDTSIWVLKNDGTVQKFTRGKSDSFSISGLDTQFANPTRIFTNTDANNVYILDRGNARIVVLNKTGEYQNQYKSNLIKNARDFDVLEKDGKAYILVGDKVYEIDIK